MSPMVNCTYCMLAAGLGGAPVRPAACGGGSPPGPNGCLLQPMAGLHASSALGHSFHTVLRRGTRHLLQILSNSCIRHKLFGRLARPHNAIFCASCLMSQLTTSLVSGTKYHLGIIRVTSRWRAYRLSTQRRAVASGCAQARRCSWMHPTRRSQSCWRPCCARAFPWPGRPCRQRYWRPACSTPRARASSAQPLFAPAWAPGSWSWPACLPLSGLRWACRCLSVLVTLP